MEADTESLRTTAPQWSLAGDQQLLGVLQNIHERLVSRCQETNRRLGEMAAALDDASVDLQNVNNKFMALSNSQFIESRVYDDDADVAPTESKAETQTPLESISEVDQIKLGLKVLEDMHEPLMILDSDSETDSDEDTSRMVLKPKDLYEDRPLPYIIGSYAWQSKWHAGLLAEDSDSDSSVKRERWEREEYSESDTEISKPVKEQESSCSSEISSHLSTSQTVEKPATIADQLAKRLGQRPEPDLQPEEYTPPAPTTKKVYRPEQPAISNIFSDEPPPLEQSFQSDDDNGEDDDIFAELRKNQPYAQSNRVQSDVTDELFGKKSGDIFSGFVQPPPPANQKSSLFTDEQEPELFAEPPPPLPKADTVPAESNVKKPIGGISVFGNKGTESIGAAILKRNRRQSSTDEDISEDTSQKQEKDIFDHLFAKSEKEQRKADKKVEKELIKEVKVDKKVDLFSDNLFDDIDDIFTSNIPKVPIKSAEKNQKSLFDDDELFSDVAVAKSKSVKDTKDNKKSIFESDDDLFSEKVEKNIPSKETSIVKGKTEAKKEESENKKSIFDSDDDLFTDKNEQAPIIQSENNKRSKIKENSDIEKKESVKSDSKKSIFDSDDDMFTDKTNNIPETIQRKKDNKNDKRKTKSIFDDDADIFSENVNTKPNEVSVNSVVEDSRKITPVPVLDSNKASSIFDDDEEDLFKSESSNKGVIEKTNDNTIVNTKPSTSPIKNISIEQKTKSSFVDEFDTRNNSEVHVKNSNSSTKANIIGKNLKKSLFDDESEDELFTDNTKQVISEPEEHTKPIESSKIAVDDDELFKEANSQTQDQILKTKIKDEILEEIKDELKNEIKDEVINELKDDVVIVKNDQNAETSKPINKSIFDNEEKDFEDSSPKDILGGNDVKETIKKSSIFDEVEDGLFSNSPKYTESKVNKVDDKIENPKLPEVDTLSKILKPEMPLSKDNHINVEPPPLFHEPKDEFSDIFIEPPKFEKPKEPKKSKNVNALFDDDSDDEALFFKKDDPTLDEKPEFDSPTTENRIFGIFQDEPPDLDIDFVQKSNVKTKKDPSSVLTNTRIDEIKSSKDQTDSNLTSNSKERVAQDSEILNSIESHDDSKSKMTKDSDDTPKSIGKLKSMNFNINVNALLPGASPKKVKTMEQTDGNTQTKSSEDISIKNAPELESKMVKSISFEGKPDSQVLDNTVSKERAKIQVKRRPSTRKARKEAVRKSGIDFGDDSTDNSSSIDDQPKVTKRQRNVPLTTSDDENIGKPAENVIKILKDNENTTTAEVMEGNKVIVNTDEELFKSENKSKIDTEVKLSGNDSEQNTENVATKDTLLQKPEVTTKTVYILNDEDIFSVEKPKKVLNIVDDDIPAVSTLGNVYKESKNNSDDEDLFRNVNTKSEVKDITDSGDKLFKSEINSKTIDDSNEKLFKSKGKNDKKVTKNIFDDELETNENSDENLFKPEPKSDSIKDSKSIFDLSDDEDLFSKNKKSDVSNEAFKKEVKKVEVKTSLFDDEDNDDDLFGSRSKKTAEPTTSSSQAHRTKDIVTKSSEPVFEDPLSLLGGEDD